MIPLPAASFFGVFAAIALGAWAASPQSSTTTHKKTSAAKHYTKSTTQARATQARTTQATTSTKTAPKTSTTSASAKYQSTAKKRPVAARHFAPQQPTPERYKEIQAALAAKGYFTGEPDGNWGPVSVDALRRFQHDQNLTEDGKIGSLSLIALGLGPKREPPAEPQKAVEPEKIP